MKRYYVPSVAPAWGDNITALWSAELLHLLLPDAEITLDDSFINNRKTDPVPQKISHWIDIDKSIRLLKIDDFHALQQFDGVIATHHRHRIPWKILGYSVDRLVHFDAHGIMIRMIRDNVYPTFRPSTTLLEQYKRLNLPDEYAVIHLNEFNRKDPRSVMSSADFYASNVKAIKKSVNDMQIFTTCIPHEGFTDLSSIHPWVKIMVMINASSVYCSFSGFTAIASMYRKRINTWIVNHPGIHTFNMGPPNICYSNYDIVDSGSYDKLYYAIENNMIEHGVGRAYTTYCTKLEKRWCQYQTFEFDRFDEFDVPIDYKSKTFYDDIENCLVPLDAKYSAIEEPNKLWDYRHDSKMSSMNFGWCMQNPRCY